MIILSNVSRLKTMIGSGILGVSVAALLIYLVMVGGNQQADKLITFLQTDFKFHVYCPIDSITNAQYYKQYFGGNLAYDAPNSSSLYVVYMQARNITTSTYTGNSTISNSSQVGLYYCGLAREWNGTCRNAQIVCSAPGPMFYLPVDQEITIIWVNNITSQGLQWNQQGCYDPDTPQSQCMIDAKLPPSWTAQEQGCTFNQPTNYSFTSRKVRVNKTQIPVSPHIHGLQTRPAFDGNPLSWFNNVGDRGVGYFSLNDSRYFYQFSQPESFYQLPLTNAKKNMKIVKAINKQLPGNLFYHDHAMKSTKYNVANGLSGLYILYNKTAEAALPSGNQQKFILFSHANDGDIRNMTTYIPPPHKMQLNHKDFIYTLGPKDIYERNMTYRFRILNAHYDNVYYNVSFAVYYKTILNADGSKSIVELDPYSESFSLTDANYHFLNFTVIGTDSALFDKPVNNVYTFDLGVAERVETLMKLDRNNGVPLQVTKFYLICFDGNQQNYVIKYRFLLANSSLPSKNKYVDPIETAPIPVPFKNLSAINKSNIALNRMRPLLSRPAQKKFLINGHYMYGMGETETPQIGTVEDWYIINNLWEPHPMHFHLINFQIIQTYSLKLTPEGCTFYELDFFRFSNYSSFQGLTNAQLCDYLNNLSMDQSKMLYHYMDNYNLQSKIVNTNVGKTTGMNVMDPIVRVEDLSLYAASDCPFGSAYKYICSDTSNRMPTWYRRWKQTALVRQYQVSVLRVRWTSTIYDQNIKPYPYFSVPQDELIQFPGFVYHCHILPHEDNEMMRPFMLTPSEKYINSTTLTQINRYSTSSLTSLFSSLSPTNPLPSVVTTKTLTGPDFWYDKAVQINKFIGCQK